MSIVIKDLSPEMWAELYPNYVDSEGRLNMRSVRFIMPLQVEAWALMRNWNDIQSLSDSNRKVLNHTISLTIDGWQKYPFLPLNTLSNINNLRTLKISQSVITTESMTTVANLCPNLERLHLQFINVAFFVAPLTLEELNPILAKFGPKLKSLSIVKSSVFQPEELFTEIAAKCPSLEEFEFGHMYEKCRISISKLLNGCPRLRKLMLTCCDLATDGEFVCSGFKDLIVFSALGGDFRGFDVCSLLKNSKNLKYLEVYTDSVLGDFSTIPSNKVQYLRIGPCNEGGDIRFGALKQAVEKWKHTLLHLIISYGIPFSKCDIISVLKIYLDNNPRPKLTELVCEDFADKDFLKIFIQKCENLKKLVFCGSEHYYTSREEIMQFRNRL